MEMYGELVSPDEATGELKKVYDEMEEMFGGVAPHIKLHATYMLEDMKCFVDPMVLTRNHPDVPLVWFALMRLYVAMRDDYPYCKELNTNMLHNLGVDDDAIASFLEDVHNAPLDEHLILLLEKALKSVYDSHHFDQDDFEQLHEAGFSDRTIYQVIQYSTQFSGIAKRLNTYLVKS